ncbi:juvenile hormone esterase-like isoform X2 [Cylas formicarius]|uniref:juvenile hormone esterase-like isoform X2 n=1 Tax=Cylas formicarius TaxID=197179 RepID=UPI002958B734|nr:juvenile hormone esterase-like isoform X2 [Cylas formicarius]
MKRKTREQKAVVKYADDLVLDINDGPIRGVLQETDSGKTFYAFKGIPYAQPPLGELRFKPPRFPQPWSDVLDTTEDSQSCISVKHFDNADAESEDCLYINVYTPSLKPTENLAVLFWIYGGGFTNGNSSEELYGPHYLIEEDVVLVTFNYRLGPFGFVSTGDSAISGNAGLKDQSFALNWTYHNIQLFGGDPKKITIFGQSAGGASCGLHLISKKSSGLFRAAICQSGSALTYWTALEDPLAYAYDLTKLIDSSLVDKNDTYRIRDVLKNATVEEITQAVYNLAATNRQVWPVVEPESEDAFIAESHYALLESGNFQRVPLMTGVTSEESLYFIPDIWTLLAAAVGYDLSPEQLVPSNFHPISNVTQREVGQQIANIYLKNGGGFLTNLAAVIKFNTDNGFVRSVLKQAELHSNYAPVYLYQFSFYEPSASIGVQLPGNDTGKAAHTAELRYLFNITAYRGSEVSAEGLLTRKRMTKLWSNFAKTLNPTPQVTELFQKVTWLPIEADHLTYLNIDEMMSMEPYLKQTTYQKWNEIFDKYAQHPLVTY